ncbi:hypothetical protein [Nitrospira sp. Kam-Ns4a]
MSDQLSSTSSVKLGLAVAWPAFWTGVPAKIVLALLFLAMGVHPWEMPGLAFLLLLSAPVDIWAWGLCARTVFLDRLRLEPPSGLGFTLWWQATAATAVYGTVASLIESGVISVAKSAARSVMELALLKSFPVAERIGIELTLWGAPATIVLVALALGWFFIVGRLVRRQAAAASPAQAPYPVLVRTWDLMRVPADPPLLLTAFVGTGVLLVFLFWGVMPVTTPHPHEEYKGKQAAKKVEPPFKPTEVLDKTDKLIAKAEAALEALEAKKQAEEQGQSKGKGQKGSKGGEPGKASAEKPKEAAVPKQAARPQSEPGKAVKAGGDGPHTHEAGSDHTH